MNRILAALFFASYVASASAEYRAYELSIINSETGSETPIISTLDHIQYRGYYPLGLNEEVVYVDSWRCHGNTKDFKPICPKPDERTPASEESTP